MNQRKLTLTSNGTRYVLASPYEAICGSDNKSYIFYRLASILEYEPEKYDALYIEDTLENIELINLIINET